MIIRDDTDNFVTSAIYSDDVVNKFHHDKNDEKFPIMDDYLLSTNYDDVMFEVKEDTGCGFILLLYKNLNNFGYLFIRSAYKLNFVPILTIILKDSVKNVGKFILLLYP